MLSSETFNNKCKALLGGFILLSIIIIYNITNLTLPKVKYNLHFVDC